MRSTKPQLLKTLIIALFVLCPPAMAGQVNYTYDDFGRLKSMSYTDTYTATQFQYAYDNAGNVIHKTCACHEFMIPKSGKIG